MEYYIQNSLFKVLGVFVSFGSLKISEVVLSEQLSCDGCWDHINLYILLNGNVSIYIKERG